MADCRRVIAIRFGKALTFDLHQTKPDDPALRAAIIGPTGKLRAPTLRVGNTLIVGYDEATYRSLLAGKQKLARRRTPAACDS